MDKALEIDAFITSQPGGDQKCVSFPPADKFQLQDGRFLVSFFFDTLAFQSQEAQPSRLSLSMTYPPPISLRRMKNIKTFAPQCANSLIFGTIPMQSSTVLVSTKRCSCSITLPWLLSTWHFLSSKRPWPSCLSACVIIIRNGIRSWFGVALPVWPLSLSDHLVFWPAVPNKSYRTVLCSCWRRGLNEMTRHSFSRRTRACLWHMTHVYTSEEIFVLTQPRFHYVNYVCHGVTWKCHESQFIFIFVAYTTTYLFHFFSSSTCF